MANFSKKYYIFGNYYDRFYYLCSQKSNFLDKT